MPALSQQTRLSGVPSVQSLGPSQEAEGFIPHTLVRMPLGERALFFRVLAADAAARTLRLRMERFTLFWQQQDVELVSVWA